MSRVFIVQNQMRRSSDNSGMESRYNFNPAREYGTLKFLLGPSAGPFNPNSVITELREKLADFSDDDYLVLVGNPCLIGWAVAIAADANGGNLKLLQWGRGRYQQIQVVDLFGDDDLQSAS